MKSARKLSEIIKSQSESIRLALMLGILLSCGPRLLNPCCSREGEMRREINFGRPSANLAQQGVNELGLKILTFCLYCRECNSHKARWVR